MPKGQANKLTIANGPQSQRLLPPCCVVRVTPSLLALAILATLAATFGIELANAATPADEVAQNELRVLEPESDGIDPAKMLYAYLTGVAKTQFDTRRAAIAALQSPSDVVRRQSEIRSRFIESLGGFPERTPLNGRVVGRLTGDGFHVEKVIYESRPGHHVTAVLYLPETTPPYPGVLVPCGHSANGKASETYQRICILLARNGMAALCYDPIGQGERYQLLNADGKPLVPASTTEHSLAGVGALLVGWQTASYRIWDGIRSLDYLAGRPDIDPRRLGCTGNSGGGTLTAYLMALDERIAVAAPSCYITSLERLFDTIGPQDAEQNITGQLAFGMEHADYVIMRAPRPTLLCVGTRDYFDITGAWNTFREAKLLYGILGRGDCVDLFEYNDTHGFSKPRREAAMRWMRRWLLGIDDAPSEVESPIFTDDQLQCTQSGQVLAEFNGKSVFDLNVERVRTLAKQRSHSSMPAESILSAARRRLALPDVIPPANRDERGTIERDGYKVTKIRFETEPGILVPALLFRAKATQSAEITVIYLRESGMAGDALPGGAIEQLCKSGVLVLALDVRGTGETSPGKPAGEGSYFGSDNKEAFLSLQLARPLIGQRVFDVLSVIGAIAIPSPHRLRIVGVGAAGPIAIHAAALESRVEDVTVRQCINSWSQVVEDPRLPNQLGNAVPGVLENYDLPDLMEIVRHRKASP